MEGVAALVYMRDSLAAGHKRYRLTADEIKGLWLERAVSLQCSTGNGEMYVPKLAEGVPGWFVGQELGMAFQQGPAYVDVRHTVRADNVARRTESKDAENTRIRFFIAEAKQKGLRTYVKPVEDARGCTSCGFCVPEARLRPRRSAEPVRARDWLPMRGEPVRRRRAARAEVNARRSQAAAERRRARQVAKQVGVAVVNGELVKTSP